MFDWLKRLAGGVRTRLTFPLLAKELTETAARRRTYVMRAGYAIMLYGIFGLIVPGKIWSHTGEQSYRLLGMGRQIFELLLVLQYCGLILFLPAMMCGRITQEKERDSLVLLFLTELRPWSIILQKYAGGLVSMLSVFLLALPLAGVAYAFGGLESRQVLTGLLGLLLMCLQIGAIALFCSAWCRSTVGAFIMTYLLGMAFYWGPPLGFHILSAFSPDLRGWRSDTYAFMLIPPAAIEMNQFMRRTTGFEYRAMVLGPSLGSVLMFLLLARRFLVRRALVPSVNFLRPLFEKIDRTMKRLNRATGGVVLWRDSANLPGDEPIFWRETHRRVLGKAHYLLRILVAVELPIVFLCLLVVTNRSYYRTQLPELSIMVAILAALVGMLISVHAANSIVSERVGQTLEVLLTTPLGARDIVRQKERAMWRLVLVTAFPMLTICGAEAYAEAGVTNSAGSHGWVPYIVCTVLMMVIYLPMITWLSLWISLNVRTRFQAIIGAVGSLAFWTALSPLLFFLTEKDGADSKFSFLILLSPASVGYLNETGQLEDVFGSAWLAIFVNCVFYAMIALLIRRRAFAHAESLLRR